MSKIGRKKFLKQLTIAGATGGLALACDTDKKQVVNQPNIITEKKYKWYMVTTWPPNFPVIGTACNRFADKVREMSNGQLDIRVYGGNELIPPLEVFDAVSSGTSHLGHGASYYWTGKVQSAQFFTTVPMGLNALEQTTWINHGGGMQLWRDIYDRFNLIPFVSGNTALQMGGWFNREINSVDDFKSLKMRIPGLAGKILKDLGATPVLVAGGEIYTNLERGVLDATEWLGPYHDRLMGFHRIAKYYYTPGWHEPGSTLEMIVNKEAYQSLPKHLQTILEVANGYLNDWMTTEMLYRNAQSYHELMNESNLEIRQFNDDILDSLRQKTDEILDQMAAEDGEIKKVYDSFLDFKKQMKAYSSISEKLYYNKINS
ncbi:TRAP transporter substrate-binding protein [Membranihabitans marinus]|uniref:TRAP transporter substrate-binding protein n=1 Tax=Membranihabitans marinus TaxID=1227546 RepID=UPI001F1DFD7D|nr:TRAP transporter substrate-binding protein [Membranihabitans marinus]